MSDLIFNIIIIASLIGLFVFTTVAFFSFVVAMIESWKEYKEDK